MNYYIGIASYKRPNNQRTLDYLEELQMPRERIIFSVQNLTDKEHYEAAGVAQRVGAFIYREGRNASQNRNNILDKIPVGGKVVLLDDDITCLCKLEEEKLVEIRNKEEFDSMISRGFSLAAKKHTAGFGVYPVCNAFFMKHQYKTRNICNATLLAIINTSLRFNPETDTKEDFEFCCDVIRKYGGFIRLDDYACKAQHHSKGGCEEFWKRKDDTARTAEALVKRYPEIIELNPRRPGEVKMVKEPKGRKR